MDLDAAREVFETSQDLTVGIEEEWAPRRPGDARARAAYEAMRGRRRQGRGPRRVAVSGELISSEIEIRSGRGEDVQHALKLQREARRRLFALADAHGVALACTGTHPLSDYREQHIIDTEHYRRVQDGLQYVARRNNTFALQVHVGIQGGDRAVKVCDRLRPGAADAAGDQRQLAVRRRARLRPALRAHRRRSRSPSRAAAIPDVFGSWRSWHDYVALLLRTNSIVEFTQLWWSVRPHHSFGTIEVRICDAQTTGHRGRRAGRADRGLRRPGAARGRRGRDAARPPGPADRGEHVARDPLRPGRQPARPRGAERSRSTRPPRRSTA